MSKIIGIDLGTTHSLAATVDSGIPLVMADSQGQRLTPSVVYFPGPDSEPVVGWEAARGRVLQPGRTVYSIKRFMGRRGNEIAQEEMLVTYPVGGQGHEGVTINLQGRLWTPEEISSLILAKLKKDAEEFFGEPVTRAVITVPAYFNDAQRSATRKAGELAGFTVERIINEPTAAALAYGLDKLKDRSKIAVYDFGGGTFDLSILELNKGVFQVLSTHGDTRLGGDDLDKRVVEFLIEKIREESGLDVTQNLEQSARVREVAEQAKKQLSKVTQTRISIPFLTPQYSLDCELSRQKLEELTGDIVMRTRAHCLHSLSDARLEPEDLDQVILVGGQTRMPLMRRLVSEVFHCADPDQPQSKGPELNTSQHPDEAIALGAAVQAEILSGNLNQVLLLDVTPLSLGIETFGGLMNVIIPRNTTIPTKAGEMFTTAVDYQPNMLIHVLQGERERAVDNWSLGRFTLDFEPAPKGVPRVGVQFAIDADGILNVLARDVKTGKEMVVPLKSTIDVKDEDVQKMVQESIDNARDDMKVRQWIEAKIRARDTILATRNGLTDCGDELPAEQRQKIEAALSHIEEMLETENPKTKTGDTLKLRAATTALDHTTRPLADLVMDKAMEELLKKRGLI
ncbi:MAG: molecular chaperone DnaK [Verrucomicrobia bacterium]|nr:molecular chaperone DnaK [Verrucomicrobiota bacterium]